mgnify:FL=1
MIPERFSLSGSAEYAQAHEIAITVAINPQKPKNHETTIPIIDINTAIQNPQLPGTLPEGIGLLGSLIASTSLSHQSLIAWLMPQTIGPDKINPINNMIDVSNEIFELDTAPHKNAHIGGNQVIGFIRIIIDDMDGKVLC